jgi:hypothetical protein
MAGRTTVLSLRGTQSRGGRGGHSRGKGRSQETNRTNVISTDIVEYDTTQNDDATDTATTREELTDRGGRPGRGFGRGTYGSQGGRNFFYSL